jgi:hypothetical protein
MLKVTIWSTWSNETSGSTWWISGSSSYTTQTVQETTLVAVPASDVDPTKGSILVAIQNASAAGLANLTVTATSSSGTVLNVTTTAGGCALFANITATSGGTPTWTISFSTISGYLTEQGLATLPTQSGLTVTAGTTTSLYFEPTAVDPNGAYDAYDKAGTVTPVYSVPQINGGLHPFLPTNVNSLPLSFYSTTLQTSPYVTSSPAQVFPMPTSPSYTVVAGSCGTESAPDGASTDGKAVTVASGGTTSAPFSLVPVQIYVVNTSQSNSIVSPATLTASTSNAAGTGSDANCPTTGSGVMPTLQLGTTSATWTALHRAEPHGRAGHRGHQNEPAKRTRTSHPQSGILVSRQDPPSPRGTDGRHSTFALRDVHGAKDTGSSPSSHPAVLLATCSSSCATSTAVVASNLKPSTAGATVTLSTTVTCNTACASTPGPPQGTVTFKEGSTTLGTDSSLTSGAASMTISTLAVGTHLISASFASQTTSKWGNSSTSSNLSQVVNTAPTTTTVLSSSNPATYGTSPVLTATVTCSSSGCGTPTGTVTFKSGGTAISTCTSVTLSSGSATCTLSAPTVGSYSLTAAYTPTTNYTSSTSGTLTQVVNTASTTTTLSSTPNPNSYGTSALLTAAVSCSASGCGSPTGTVTFKNNGTNITGCVSVTVSSGSATCTLSGLNGGTYSISAAFTATANYGSSTSSTITQNVTAASTTTALTSSANPSTYNGSVTLTATVTPASGAPAVGTVTFYDTTTSLGTATLNGSGVATLATAAMTIGQHLLSAVFTPTNANNFGSSTSSTLPDTVNTPGGASYVLVGLPYGVWHLSATYNTYNSTTATIKVVITVTPSGVTVTTGSTYVSLEPVGSTAPVVTVYIK